MGIEPLTFRPLVGQVVPLDCSATEQQSISVTGYGLIVVCLFGQFRIINFVLASCCGSALLHARCVCEFVMETVEGCAGELVLYRLPLTFCFCVSGCCPRFHSYQTPNAKRKRKATHRDTQIHTHRRITNTHTQRGSINIENTQ